MIQKQRSTTTFSGAAPTPPLLASNAITSFAAGISARIKSIYALQSIRPEYPTAARVQHDEPMLYARYDTHPEPNNSIQPIGHAALRLYFGGRERDLRFPRFLLKEREISGS